MSNLNESEDRPPSSRLILFGRQMLSVAVTTILVMLLIALVLVACEGGTASTVVNSL